MIEDKATQGWRWAEDDDLPAYVLESPDGTRWQITKDFAHPDELVAALQRPVRETCTTCKALHRFHYVPPEHTHSPTKPPSHEAALVEALRDLHSAVEQWQLPNIDAEADWAEENLAWRMQQAKALISPPGLSEGGG